MTRIHAKVKKLYPDSQLPTQGHPGDAGYDIYVHRVEDKGSYYKVYSGIAVEPASGYYFEIFPRSSIYKKECFVSNSAGIIDSQYRGELIGILYKRDMAAPIKKGERLLQMIARKQIQVDWEEVEELTDTSRGDGGFGSTGRD